MPVPPLRRGANDRAPPPERRIDSAARMRVHHLNCGSLCPHGARLLTGEGGWLEPADRLPLPAIETDDARPVDTGFGVEDARNPRRSAPPSG